eukprot:364577-Chlamydomonas_euryale.AAC.16
MANDWAPSYAGSACEALGASLLTCAARHQLRQRSFALSCMHPPPVFFLPIFAVRSIFHVLEMTQSGTHRISKGAAASADVTVNSIKKSRRAQHQHGTSACAVVAAACAAFLDV